MRGKPGRKLPRGVFPRDGVFWIRYADQFGRVHREKVGPFLKQAQAAYQKRKSEVREGKFFPDKLMRRAVLFDEIAQDFLEYSKQTKRSYGHDLGRSETLLRLWRGVSVTDLSPGRIERDLAESAKDAQWMPATYNRHRVLVSGIFSLASHNGKATANPVEGTKHRTENNTRVRFLTHEEEGRLMEQVRATCPDLEPQIVVALHSGMRRSEQYVTPDCPDRGLKWQHIDFHCGVITLPRSKNGESRHIKMNSALRATLVELRNAAGSRYVFPVEPLDKLFPEVCRQAA